MSSYYSRIMNIPAYSAVIDYRYGHRDARHAAANIATEAEREIADLKAQIERKDEALEYIVKTIKNQQKDNWLNQDIPEYLADDIQYKAEQALQNKE